MKLLQNKFQSLFSGSLQPYDNPLLELYISSTYTYYSFSLSIIFWEKSSLRWHHNTSNHNQAPDIHRIPLSNRKGKKITSFQSPPLAVKSTLCIYINYCLSPIPGTFHSPISSNFSMSRIICFGSFIFSTAARTIIRCFLF